MPSNLETKFDYANEIWNVADAVRDAITSSEYNKVILPFTLLRRLECVLEPTRNEICKLVIEHEVEWGHEHDQYANAVGKPFYNITSFRLNNLGSTNTYNAIETYIDGFTTNVRDIFEKFQFKNTCKHLDNKNLLYLVCTKFAAFDLSPEHVSDREMTNIYEHLIEKFGEEIAENAEDFMTPKDVVRLAVGMIFANDEELLNSDSGIVRSLYDQTAGTCGFICDALDMLEEMQQEKKMKAPCRIVPYGQEVEDKTWAMGKINLMIRNAGRDAYDSIIDMSEHLMLGDTLADDKFSGMTFDYQLSNPPYGKKWESSKSAVVEEANEGFSGRFGAGMPKISDGSMLFIQNAVSKMKPKEEGGGKVGIVLSGSPLFSSDKGSSDIRRWLLQEDLIDCIVKLPAGIFYRTGINTYLWILNNNKPLNRQNVIQLINAEDKKTLLKKNLGQKRAEIGQKQREWIIEAYVNGIVNDDSIFVPYTDFMYRQVVTRRPLRAKVVIQKDKISGIVELLNKLKSENLDILVNKLAELDGTKHDYSWADSFAKSIRSQMNKPNVGCKAIADAIRNVFLIKSNDYDICLDNNGKTIFDKELDDYEDIPFNISFDDYMNKEVLPYASDTVIDNSVLDNGPLSDGNIGVVKTNIIFNRYFYHYIPPRNMDDIAKEIIDIESGLEKFIEDFLNE